MRPTDPIVIGSGNPHKISEIGAILGEIGVEVVGLSDLGGPFEEPAEGRDSFEANATLKAMSYVRQTGRWCLADDSGLSVDALGGAPGVMSSHYATDGAETGLSRGERDKANNRHLLKTLSGIAREDRRARFVCVMVLARPDDAGPVVVATTRGTFEGRIGELGKVPRGAHGFGYDPLFLVGPDFERTSAELRPDEKNALSHRAAAARAMSERLRGA